VQTSSSANDKHAHNIKKIIKDNHLLWLGTLVLFAFAVNISWFIPARIAINEQIVSLHLEIAERARDHVLDFVDIHLRELENVATAINSQPANAEAELDRLLRENVAIGSVAAIDLSGQEAIRRGPDFLSTNANLRSQITNTAFLATSEYGAYTGPVVVSSEDEPIMIIAVAADSDSEIFEEPIKALIIDLNLNLMSNLIGSIGVGDRGFVYVVDSTGLLIAHADIELVKHNINLLERTLVRNVLSGAPSNTFEENSAYVDFDGADVIAVGLPVEVGKGWGVVAEQSKYDASLAQRQTLRAFAVSVGVALIFVFILYFVFLRSARATKQLENERNQGKAILNSLSDGVVGYDAESRIFFVNPKATELLGITPEEVSGLTITPEILKTKPELKPMVELMYPAFAHYASSIKTLPDSSDKVMELHISKPELKLLVTMTQVTGSDGAVKGFLKILRDVSREQMFARFKSEFVSIAAHQLRTPLSAIKWTIRLLLDEDVGSLNKEQIDLLNKGYSTNERMIKLVSDLLNVARIEEGRFGYEFKEISLKDLLQGLIDNLSLEASSKNVNIKFEKPKESMPPVYVDPEKLSLAINNLLGNAIKYNSSGGNVAVTVVHKGHFVEISIADTGVGIPQAEQKRAFSKFFRASNVMRLETEGTGLGLFIVRNIIKRHGGDISFKSKENQGTVFTFTLPIGKKYIPKSSKEDQPVLEEFLEAI
jgi:PAS domain S-box-containing protein